MSESFRILYEDNHILAIDKPAGWATMGVDPSRPSLIHEAKSYLKRKYQKPGNVYLGVVSRLDSVTTGVVLLARTSKAASRLAFMFRSRNVDKTYLAVVAGEMESDRGSWTDWILKNDTQRKMQVVAADQPGAKRASLSYHCLKTVAGCSVLRIKLETGRKHQIRVQAASRGHPLLGDRKYGSRLQFPVGISLHAWRIQLTHPVRKTRLVITSGPPKSWRPYLSRDELH